MPVKKEKKKKKIYIILRVIAENWKNMSKLCINYDSEIILTWLAISHEK